MNQYSGSFIRWLHPHAAYHRMFTDWAAADIYMVQEHHQFGSAHPLCRASAVNPPTEAVDMLQCLCLTIVGKEPAETDTMESLWEYMCQKQTDKFFPGYGLDLFCMLVCVIRIAEGNHCIRNCLDTAVADRSTVRIPAEILQGVPVAIEGLFDKGAPGYGIKVVDPCFPGRRIHQILAGPVQGKQPFFIKLFEMAEIFPTEHLPEDLYWKDETFVPGLNEVTGWIQPATGDHGVQMGVEIQLLPPGMQYRHDPRGCPHILFITA